MDQDFWSILKFIEVSHESVFLKMYMVESKAGAIACMLFSLLFLGTWPALLTLLERRGRLPQHTYLDYTITNLLAATLIAFIVGEIGSNTMEHPSFFTQLSQLQDNWHSVLFAIAGGVVLTLGNLSTQYAWAFVGSSVTEVITATITVVIVDMNDLENGVASEVKAKARTALFLTEVENKRAMKVFGKSTYIGLVITFFAGACLSLFSPAFNLATNDQLHALRDGIPHLSVYTTFFYFSVSNSLLATILNFTFLSWDLLAGLLSGFGKSPIYGRSSSWICGCRCFLGTTSCEHMLGGSIVWRVPKIIRKNVYASCRNVNHVHSSCCNPHDICRKTLIDRIDISIYVSVHIYHHACIQFSCL